MAGIETGRREFPIAFSNLLDWFPCAHVENPLAGDPWWSVQAVGTLAATQILRMVPAGDEQQQALVELRRCIDTALLVIPAPPDEEIQKRLAQTLAPWCPSPWPIVDAMLNLAELTSADVLFDLGSGDGRIVLEAAKRGAQAVGIEIDGRFVAESTERIAESAEYSRASFRRGDILQADLSEATVITCYLLSQSMAALEAKFRALRSGTRIISHAFLMTDWQPTRGVSVDGTPIYLWIV
jgi:SAM-dependent methyltransferase